MNTIFKISALAACVAAGFLAACGGGGSGTAATSTPAPGATATATSTPAPGATATATSTPAPGATATSTPAPGATNTPTPAATPTSAPCTGAFIKGTVDGSVRNATVDVTGSWVNNGGAGSALTGKTMDSPAPAVWTIQHLENTVGGPYACNVSGSKIGAITFSDPTVVVNPMTDAMKIQVTSAGGSLGACSVTVTASSANSVEGTFTATLHNNLGYSRTVTNGSFKVCKTN